MHGRRPSSSANVGRATEDIRAPSKALLLLETRALWELGLFLAARPALACAPRGDGHGVLVMPGLGGSELSTRPLRGFLRRLGYGAHDWKLGRNLGPGPETMTSLQRRLRTLEDGRSRARGLMR